MIWESCQLQVLTGQTKDALGNMVGGEWQTVKNEQRFAIPIPFGHFPNCTHAVISGYRQKINQKINLAPRYTVIQVRIYKE